MDAPFYHTGSMCSPPHGIDLDFRFGCGTFARPISRHALWLPRRVPRSAGPAAPPAHGLHATTSFAEISDLPALSGPCIHPKVAQRTKRLFVTASSRFRGRQLSSGAAPHVSLPAPAAPRSAAACRRTAAGSDVLPPAGASRSQQYRACFTSRPPVFTSRGWRLVSDQRVICDSPGSSQGVVSGSSRGEPASQSLRVLVKESFLFARTASSRTMCLWPAHCAPRCQRSPTNQASSSQRPPRYS